MEKGIKAERKSIYRDFKELSEHLGFEIIQNERGRYNYIDRLFELSELKLLVDAILSSKFISEKHSQSLIEKIKTLCSQYEGAQLTRQMIVANRPKTTNTRIFHNVDTIYAAMSDDKRISFRYFSYDRYKNRKYRDKTYDVSPYTLIYTDDNYYLVGRDRLADQVKHFRVDRMEYVAKLPNDRIEYEQFSKNDIASYTKYTFNMYGGKVVKVQLRFANYLANVALDRFGHSIYIVPDGKDHFMIEVDIAESKTFYGWLLGLGGGAQIISPQSVIDGFAAHLDSVRANYEAPRGDG